VGGNFVPNSSGFFCFWSMVGFPGKGGGSKTRVIILNKDGLNVMQLKLLSIIIFEGGVLCLENRRSAAVD